LEADVFVFVFVGHVFLPNPDPRGAGG
jgi:hypothetical protein